MHLRIRDTIIFMGFTLIALLMFAFITNNLFEPYFSPDSYSYWELSKTIFTDFYRINTHRQYMFTGDYGTSFPPLFPFLIASFNKVADIGIYAGQILNFGILVVIFWSIFSLWKGKRETISFPIILIFLIFLDGQFLEEIKAGRTIPLAFCFQLLMLIIFIKKDGFNYKDIALLGLLSGLSILNRFDFLMAGFLLGFVVASLGRNNKLLSILIYYLVMLIAISPWIIYSELNFSTFFVSDNSPTVLLAELHQVLDYYPPDYEPTTIFSSTVPWIYSKITNISNSFKGLKYALRSSYYPTIWLIAGVSYLSVIILQRNNNREMVKNEIKHTAIKGNFIPSFAFGLIFIAIIFSVFLPGYRDARYYSGAFLYLTLMLFLWLENSELLNLMFKSTGIKLKEALGIVILLVTAVFAIIVFLDSPVFLGSPPNGNIFERDYIASNIEIYRTISPEQILLLKLNEKDETNILVPDQKAAPFGAISGLNTYFPPHNLDQNNLVEFIDEYDIDYILKFEDYDYFELTFEIIEQTLTLEQDQKFPSIYRIVH